MRISGKDNQRLFHIIKYCRKLSAVKQAVHGSYDDFTAKPNYEKVDVSAFYIGQIGELVHGLTDDDIRLELTAETTIYD